MNTIKLTVSSEIYNCNWEFERRLNIIRGDSGIGKTTLVEILTTRPQGIEIYTSLPTVTVLENSWKNTLEGTSNSILLFDDIAAIETSDFANLFKRTIVDKNNYVIAISRENQFQPGKLGRLPFSINSMYKEITEGTNHFLTRLYDENVQKSVPEKIDCVIVEDSGKGYHFFQRWMHATIISAKSGNSAIVKTLIDVSDKYKNIFLIFDTAAYGCYMEQLVTVIAELDVSVFFMDYYECFEELLVTTNLLSSKVVVKEEFEKLSYFANKYISWERYFEDLALRASYGLPYEYNHNNSKLRFCYLHNCSECNEHIKCTCDQDCEGNKFEWLLRGTKYEDLLRLTKDDCEGKYDMFNKTKVGVEAEPKPIIL